MTVVEGALVVVIVLMQGLPVLVVVGPPVVMAALRRWSLGGVALWLAGIGLGVASLADMDRADATGGSGSIVHGIGWLVAAVAVAAACIVLAARPRGVQAQLQRPTGPAAG